MPKTRMNESIRFSTHKALMAHKFDAKREELKQRKYDLADESYFSLLSEAELKILNEAPTGFFREQSTLYLSANSDSFTICMSITRRTPYAWGQYSTLQLGSAMSKKWAKYDRDAQALKSETEETGGVLSATMRTFRYVEDLIAAWPECEKFIPKDLKKAATTALAIPPKKLNQMLGLP